MNEIDKNLCPHGTYILLKRNRQSVNKEVLIVCPVVKSARKTNKAR